MDIQIRELSMMDIMPMVSVLNKLDYKKIKSVLDDSKKEAKQKAKAANVTDKDMENDDVVMGFALDMFLPVVGVILEELPSCEKPLYSWLASMCGVSEKEFRAMPPAVLPEALYNIIHQERFGDFFKAASKFLG